MDLSKIRRKISARHQLREACMTVGGRLTIDFETKEVVCKLPNNKELVALDDVTLELIDPETGTNEYFYFVKIVPDVDKIFIQSRDRDIIIPLK